MALFLNRLKRLSSFQKDLLAITFLITLSLVFLAVPLFGNRLLAIQDYSQGDITHMTYPFLNLLGEELKAGRLPLWTDKIWTGFPLAASGVGVFYIPNLILFGMLKTPLAFNLSYIFVFTTATIGTFYYCRFLKLTRLTAILSSVIFAFSFSFTARLIHLPLLQSFSLIPWVFLLSEMLVKKPHRILIIILAFILSQIALTGFIQGFIYTVAAVSLLLIFKYSKNFAFFKGLLLLFAAVLLSLLLSGMQVLPTIELIGQSSRANLASQGYSFPFTIKDLAYFIAPFAWGNPATASYIRPLKDGLFWENNFYSGIIPFALLLLGIINIRKIKSAWPYLALQIVILLFSLGVLFFLQYIPPFSMFRIPQRSMIMMVFSYAIVCGISLEYLLQKIKLPRKQLIVCLLTVPVFAELFFQSSRYNSTVATNDWLKTPATVEKLLGEEISGRILTVNASSDWERIYKEVSHGWRGQGALQILLNRDLLHPNTNMIHNIPAFYGYTTFKTNGINNMLAVVFVGSKLGNNEVLISSTSAKLLGMESVEFIISPQVIRASSQDLVEIEKLENSKTKSTYRIYRNLHFKNRIRPVEKLQIFSTANEAALFMTSNSFDPKTTAVGLGIPSSTRYDTDILLENVKEEAQKIEFETKARHRGLIVISDSIYPGWKLEIDGKPSSLIEVDLNSRGFQIPQGHHKIHLFYKPQSFDNGIHVTLFGISLCVFIIFLPQLKKVTGKIKITEE